MGRYSRSKTKGKKPIVAAIAAILAAGALIGGAFAWTDFTQSRTNKFHGTNDADVTLHDEFDGENKDVFVENSGTNTIYVRVRLDEFMKVSDRQFDPNADIRDKKTWTTHTYDGADITDCDHAADGKFHDFYDWKMTGESRKYNLGTPGMVYGTLGSDGKVDLTSGPNTTAATAAPITLSKYVDIKDKFDNSQPMTADETAIWDAVTTSGCWILDDSETAVNGGGWAYWSMPLLPDTATNMLLDEVKLKGDAEDDWIYRIDVKLQAVTLGDVMKWHDDNSTTGYKLTPGIWALIHEWQNK